MLIVNYVIDTLPMKRQKNEDFDDLSQMRTTTKRTEEGRKNEIKTNISSQQTKCAKMALP